MVGTGYLLKFEEGIQDPSKSAIRAANPNTSAQEGAKMSNARIIIQAVDNGETLAEESQKNNFRFRKNDTGVLTWRYAKEGALLPLVIWDNDPKKESRRILFIQIEIIGVENMGKRLLISQ